MLRAVVSVVAIVVWSRRAGLDIPPVKFWGVRRDLPAALPSRQAGAPSTGAGVVIARPVAGNRRVSRMYSRNADARPTAHP